MLLPEKNKSMIGFVIESIKNTKVPYINKDSKDNNSKNQEILSSDSVTPTLPIDAVTAVGRILVTCSSPFVII